MKYVYLFSEGDASMRELLGGKGANLAEMTKIGLPVPQGFTISTEACTKYYEDGKQINPDIMVLQGAGISGPDDVANVIRAGAQATGCTSGVMKAADPEAAAEEMLYTLRKTWDEVNGK